MPWWEAAANEVTLETTGFNSLADEGSVDCDDNALDNTSNLESHAVFQLDLGASTDMSGGDNFPYCELRQIASYDGTNYPTSYAAGEVIGRIRFAKASGQRYATLDLHPIGPLKYKYRLTNKTGVSFPSSGVTLKVKTYSPA